MVRHKWLAIQISASLLLCSALAATPAQAADCSPESSDVSGGMTQLKFSTVSSCDWTVPSGASTVEVLIVGGGGGGGGYAWAGGGGGGEVVLGTSISLTPGAKITISVGAGGAGGINSSTGDNRGANGGDTSFGSVVAKGGGGGGGYGTFVDGSTTVNSFIGRTGGSAGGLGEGGTDAISATKTTNVGYSSFANASGAIVWPVIYQTGSGGGGAGGAGGDTTAGPGDPRMGLPGVGGAGYAWHGSYFGAGGGGGANADNGTAGAAGGSGVGGNGGGVGGVTPTAGAAGTGSGGGGAGNGSAPNFSSAAGGAGGSGVVLIRFSATKPGAPTDVTVVAKNKKVQLQWKAPTRIGGSAIVGYRVEYQLSGAASWSSGVRGCAASLTEISTATFCDLAGLVNGQTYYFRVAAINSTDASDWATSPMASPGRLGVR